MSRRIVRRVRGGPTHWCPLVGGRLEPRAWLDGAPVSSHETMAESPRTTPFPAISHALPPTVERARRRRRPSGAPPPLPRDLGSTGKAWLLTAVAALVFSALYLMSARGPTRHRAGGLRHPAPDRAAAGRLVDGRGARHRSSRLRLDDHVHRHRHDHRSRRPPALAPSLHVPRGHRRPRVPRWDPLRRVLPPEAVRRDDHRPLGRLLDAVAARRRPHRDPGGSHLHPGRARTPPHDGQGRDLRGHRASTRRPGSTLRWTTPRTYSSGARSPWRSR